MGKIRFAGIAAASISMIMIFACGKTVENEVAVHKALRGDFFNSVTVSGELQAASSQVISAPSLNWPMNQLKVAFIIDDGMKVEKGDTLVLFDNTDVQKTLTDAQNSLEIANAELSKAKVNHRSALEGLEADLKISEINYEVSKIDLEKAEFEADIDKQNIQLDLEQAKNNLEQARQEIESTRKVQAEELSKQQLQVQQAQNKVELAEKALASLVITAPTPGLAIIKDNYSTREKYQVDDQLWSGWPMIGLPDLNVMEAVVQVNEVDISRVKVGQETRVRMDAFPDTSYVGEITDIATLAQEKDRDSRVKVFETKVLIKDHDEKLLPGMTVSCEIIIERVPDVVFVPLEALFSENDETFIYVKKGRGFDKRKVLTGMENDNYVVIKDGLEKGEEVALSDPYWKEEEKKDSKVTDEQAGKVSQPARGMGGGNGGPGGGGGR